MNSVCPMCKGDVSDGEDKVVLREKGSAGIKKTASQERKDSQLRYIVHKACWQTYTNKLQIAVYLKKSKQEKECSGSCHPSLRSTNKQP